MVKYDEKGQFDRVVCDKCEAGSPPTADLIVNHGLTGMGWKCSGGSHICPGCKEPEVARTDHMA